MLGMVIVMLAVMLTTAVVGVAETVLGMKRWKPCIT